MRADSSSIREAFRKILKYIQKPKPKQMMTDDSSKSYQELLDKSTSVGKAKAKLGSTKHVPFYRKDNKRPWVN